MTIRTTNFDAIAASAPLDRQASVIRDGSGDLWEPKVDPRHAHWKDPPLPECRLPFGKEDLSGRRVGRMTVIRYHSRAKSGSRWLVRCSCGSYELRRTKAITEPKDRDGDHCCNACNILKVLVRRDSARKDTRESREADAALLDRLAEGSR